MPEFDERVLQEQVDDLYDNAPCGYLSIRPDGTFLKINRTLLDWLGYNSEECLGLMRFQELLSIGSRIYYETHFAPLLSMQGFVNEIALDVRKKDGQILPVLAAAMQRRNSTGSTIVNRITLFNITDRKKYERELLIERRRAEAAALVNAELAHELQEDIAARTQAEAQLRQQVNFSSFAAHVATQLIEQDNLPSLLRGCINVITERLHATHAAVWILRDEDTMLELLASSGVYKDLDDSYARVSVDSLKISRIITDCQGQWTNEIAVHPLLPPQEWPRREGICAFAGFPLVIEHRVIGLMALFFRDALSEMMIQVISSAANQIALGMERICANHALSESEAQLRSLAQQLEHRVTQRTSDLLQSQQRLRALATELNLAEQRERTRLAAELHDHLQQVLVLGKIKLGLGKRMAHASPAATVMLQVDDLLTEALTYTRTLVTELNPPVLRNHGLCAGLRWLTQYMERHDLRVTLIVPEQERTALPEDHAVLLFQSVRELLINSAKHAGTGEATVTVEWQESVLNIEVSDKGKGFETAAAQTSNELSSKFGLFSIQERMHALGGVFTVQSSHCGTICVLQLPLVPGT
jgi:PAS domain S-box-containing protein